DPRIFGENLGPGRASRAMAIVHIAMFDTVNDILKGYTSYTGALAVQKPISIDAAIAQAAHDTLASLFPSQAAAFDASLAAGLGGHHRRHEKANGIDLGGRVADAILAMRVGDGAEIPEPHVNTPEHPTSDQPGHWGQDPISLIPLALGAHWGE